MAWLYVTEIERVNQTLVDGQIVMSPQMPPVADYRIAIGAGSVPSPAFQKATRFVMTHADAPCSLAWADPPVLVDPVAVATAHRLGQNETRFYGVLPLGKLAVITNV